MDAVVIGALEEICFEGIKGLFYSQRIQGVTLYDLWPKINSYLSSNGLPLCNNVKKAFWSNLLSIPSLNFECNGGSYDAGDPEIQSVEDSEKIGLKILAADHLLKSFVGVYDHEDVPEQYRHVLDRIAIARTDGVTQNDLAKELGIENRSIFYTVKKLESRGLIVKRSTLIRNKEVGNEGGYKNGSTMNTNTLYLYRYAKHLGSFQRLEITKEDKAFMDGDLEEGVKEDVHIKDYTPALTAICDKLEKANDKVLVVSDIKKELGYCKTSGHRAWRNILHRLKDAGLVEEFYATVNNKKVSCLRLLKKFSPKSFAHKSCGAGDDDLDTEQVKPAKRGQITEQLVELPIERQIYDMIDAEGSKGLTLNEACKRLGINNKEYHKRNRAMVSKYGMHLVSERLNKGVVDRAWTSRNFKIKVSNTLHGKLENTMDEKSSNHANVGQLQLAHTIHDSDHLTSKVDREEDNFDSRSLYIRQCDGNGISSDVELQMANVKPVEKVVSLEISSSAKPALQNRRSYTDYPRLGLNSTRSQREQRILEELQEKKVLIRSELPRLLESLENLEKKHTMMDRKTLDRSLNNLQKEGKCKCISISVPSVTNCLHTSTIVVVLHPSVYNADDLLDRAQERLRSFQRQIRTQAFSRHKSNKSIPVLNNVERITTDVTKDQSETYDAKRKNGYISGKMVRAKLLHVFIWDYITMLPDWDNAISGKHGYELKNPRSACKLFKLDAAYKAMPLELFLQVVGSSSETGCLIEKCRNDLCLSELPIKMYRCLMDTRATTNLSALIDILKRLKLIRLIDEERLDVPMGPHVTLRHSLELKPYIEEPARMVLPSSTDADAFDIRPCFRHDFVLESRKEVDEYWNTLEYCYAASDRKAALHAFPGSVVKEVFLFRSWESHRTMTADQKAKILKLVANEDIDKKISYKKCKEIAENLNLTLEQVLRYDKQQNHKPQGSESAKEQESRPLIQAPSSYKRKRSLKGKPINNGMKNVDQELGKLKHAKTFIAEDVTEERTRALEDDEMETLIDKLDGQKEAVDDLEQNAYKDGRSHPTIRKYARHKRFSWTEYKDRQLVIEYIRNRAALGVKFHGTDWASLQSLPASPHTCQRRMSNLNSNKQFRKAVKRLCNMLSLRYAKHLENSNNPLGEHTNDSNTEEQWDDFDDKDIKMVLDEVLRCKQTAKSEANKGCGMLMNGGKGFCTQTYISLAVSNAIELLKIVCLSQKAPDLLPKKARDLLAETTCQYSVHDMHTAINHLRERNFMVKGGRVSDLFTRNRSSSPFPLNTGERADEMGKWVNEREDDLLDKGVDLYADVQCGDVLQLCLLMYVGEVSMFPCLPDEGVGEIDDSKKHNRDDNDFDKAKKPKLLDSEIFCRKEKGFPGLKVSLSRSMISRVDTVASFPEPGPDPGLGSNLGHKLSSGMTLNGKSIWEDMACYGKHVAYSEVSPFLFKTVYSAIQEAGDQGLSMEGISNMIDDVQKGENIAKLIVEVLEAFGRALKVNGYDSVHVVDSKYRSKYFFLATPHQQHLDQKKLRPENNLMKENCVNASSDKMHRVTIVNHHSEEVVTPTMDRACYKPILPWVNVDGTINEGVYKGLVRRLLGIVMQNPGILEEHVIGHMNVLNPQSCRKLLEEMILDGHITVRKMYESISNGPPPILVGFKKPKMFTVCRQHFFANPRSISFL